jgi:hypothetical protein
MRSGTILRSTLAAIVVVLLLAPPVMADTCCANIPVQLDPPSAMPGDTVRLIGLQCRRADNSGPLPLNLGAFWLWPGKRAADAQPDTAPGPGLPGDLPPTEEWLSFATVPDVVVGSGDATITVPDLPDGTYQLWWWCDDGSGPGGGIHYSTGPRLAIGVSPNTDTEGGALPDASGSPGWPAGLVVAVGVAGFLLTLRFPYARGSRDVGGPPGRT